MYNLAKLLIEEPEKLERLFILFIKLLIVLFFGSSFLGLTLNISTFINDPIENSFSLIAFIKFIAVLFVVWHIIWTIIIDTFFKFLILNYIGKIVKKQNLLDELLVIFKVLEYSNSTLMPSKNFELFDAIIQDFDEESKASFKSHNYRIIEYGILIIIIYLILLFNSEISINFYISIIYFIVLLFVVVTMICTVGFYEHFFDNIDDLKFRFGKYSYFNKVNNCLRNNKFLKTNYEINSNNLRVKLFKINVTLDIPNKITFSPFYITNGELGAIFIDSKIDEIKKLGQSKNDQYFVIVSNIHPSELVQNEIKKLQNVAYLICNNKKEITDNINNLLLLIGKDLYEFD